MDNPNNLIFSRSRIANVMAAIMIIWCLALWTHILFAVINNTYTDIQNKDLLHTMLSILSGVAGFATKHLLDTDCKEV